MILKLLGGKGSETFATTSIEEIKTQIEYEENNYPNAQDEVSNSPFGEQPSYLESERPRDS